MHGKAFAHVLIMKSGPIILIEDDTDDKEVLESIFRELKVQKQQELLTFLRPPLNSHFLFSAM